MTIKIESLIYITLNTIAKAPKHQWLTNQHTDTQIQTPKYLMDSEQEILFLKSFRSKK